MLWTWRKETQSLPHHIYPPSTWKCVIWWHSTPTHVGEPVLKSHPIWDGKGSVHKQTNKQSNRWTNKKKANTGVTRETHRGHCYCCHRILSKMCFRRHFRPLKRFSEQTPPTDVFGITIYHQERKFIGWIMRNWCVLEDCVWCFWAPSRWEMVVYIVEFKCDKSRACRQTSKDAFTYFFSPLAQFLNHLTDAAIPLIL